MAMRLLSYITGSEVFGELSVTDEKRLERLISKLPVSNSLILLCHSNALLGLFPPRFEKEYIEVEGVRIATSFYVQLVLSTTFLSDSVRNKLSADEFNGRPAFSRRQLLYILTRLLLFGSDGNKMKPLENFEDRHYLGRLLLNYSNVLVPEDMEFRSSNAENEEASANELVLQMIPNFELDNPPYFDNGVARSLDYLESFDELFTEFTDGMKLDDYFKCQTGIGLRNYLYLLTAVYFHYLKYVPDVRALVADPAGCNISAKTYFSNFDFTEKEMASFFELTSISIPKLVNQISSTPSGTTREQYDFTIFRRMPLIFLTPEIFTCVDLGFLAEKVSFGFFRTIHNCLPNAAHGSDEKDKGLASKLSSAWGKVIENYASMILKSLPNFWPSVTFHRAKGQPEEIDGIFLDGNDLVIVETKGGSLSATAKYSGGEHFFVELDKKFGKKAKEKSGNDKGGIQQLLQDVEILFPKEKKNANSLTNFSCPTTILDAKNIFPVLVVEERLLELDLVQWRLRSWFREELEKKEIASESIIHPLLVLPIEILEWLEPHLQHGDFSFLEFVQYCSSLAQNPQLPFWETDTVSSFKGFLSVKDITSRQNERLKARWNNFLESLTLRLGKNAA